jgi:hypothetical protein
MPDYKISAIEGNRQRLDGGSMFGNAPRPVWERWAAPDAVGRIELACRSLLIEGDGKKVLCETGIGLFSNLSWQIAMACKNPIAISCSIA